MTLFMSKLMSGIMELLIVSVIPFITWLIWRRKKVGFFDWIGLKKVQTQQKRAITTDHFWFYPTFYFFFRLWSLVGSTLAKRPQQLFLERESRALPAILAYAILGTALPEEIFFRGFLLKRMQGKLGFLGANLRPVSLIWAHPCTYVYPTNWLPKGYGHFGLYQSHSFRFGCYQ